MSTDPTVEPRPLLARLTEGRENRPPIDTDQPILPEWMRDRLQLVDTARKLVKRTGYRIARQGAHTPAYVALLVLYAPRGGWRVLVALSRYLYDFESRSLQHAHAGAGESREYVSLERARKDHLRARWIVAGVLSTLAALGAVLVYLVAPLWVSWAILGAVVAALGWQGRPLGKRFTKDTPTLASAPGPLRAPVVTQALCDLGIGKMKDPGEIRLLMDPSRHGPGYEIGVELPAGVPATAVVERREELAAALRRELGCCWPMVGPRHPGHLQLFVSDEPMSSAAQKPWPLAKAGAVNLFRPAPLFTDQRNRWIEQTIAYTAWVTGAVPRMGKSYFVRQFGLVAGLDVRAKVIVCDLKGTGDLSPLALFAHAYHVGDEDEEIAEQLATMRWVHQEMRRRTRLVRDLTLEENPEKGKVTDALATAAPDRFGPIVVLVDECQVWYEEHSVKAVREEFIAISRDLTKRGPALGIVPLFSTQKPSTAAIPSSIADNASMRVAFKTSGQIPNDQILGTSSYKEGLRSTQFAFSDKGIAIFKGDGAEPLTVRTVHNLDAITAEKVAARARSMREAAGRLTGDAAGEVMGREAEQVVLLDDVRKVFGSGDTAHLDDLVGGLAELRPQLYGALDARSLGSQLRAAGVEVGNVYSPGKPRERATAKGVRRAALEVSTTRILGDEDPDEDGSDA